MKFQNKAALAAAFVLAAASAAHAQSAPHAPYAQSPYWLAQAPSTALVEGSSVYAYAYPSFSTFTQDGASRESFGGF